MNQQYSHYTATSAMKSSITNPAMYQSTPAESSSAVQHSTAAISSTAMHQSASSSLAMYQSTAAESSSAVQYSTAADSSTARQQSTDSSSSSAMYQSGSSPG